MADTFKAFDEEELKTLWKLLKKLYRFDGVELDGLEENVNVPNAFSDEEIKSAIDRFSNRRNTF
ncbi:MAG: hypothetical protein E7250_14885 [Paenibacillaceae bacterium]|nr:hypothetical protein [Paenibacillaceae bacterium]